MNIFQKSDEFDAWLAGMKTLSAKPRLLCASIVRQKAPVGGGVSEMRIHYGPGYRVYFTRRDAVIYLLLLGSDKSTQKRDIKRAMEMASTLRGLIP